MAFHTLKPTRKAITLDKLGRAATGNANLRHNAGTNRTASKRAPLEAIENPAGCGESGQDW